MCLQHQLHGLCRHCPVLWGRLCRRQRCGPDHTHFIDCRLGISPHGRGADRDLATNSVLGTVGAPFIDVGNGTGVLAANRLMGCLMGTNLTVPGFQFRKLFQLCLIQALSILYAGTLRAGTILRSIIVSYAAGPGGFRRCSR